MTALRNGMLPHDLTAERSLIGSLLIDPSLVPTVSQVVGPETFYLSTAADAFRALQSLASEGKAVDATLVLDRLQKAGRADETTSRWLVDVTNEVPHSGHAAYYAQILRDRHARRQLIKAASDALERAKDVSVDVGDLAANLTESLEQIEAGARGETAEQRFPLLDGAGLDSLQCRVEYLVSDLLAAGQPCILAGPKKSLKTGVLLDLAISLSAAVPFLGKFHVPTPRRVLMMSGESGEYTLQESARRIANAKGINLCDLSGFHISFTVPQIADDSDMMRLEQIIASREIEVVALDPMYLALAGLDDAASMFKVGRLLWRLTKLAASTGITPIICHHTRKTLANPFSQPELGDMAWAGFSEWARQWLLINRREAYDPESGGVHRLWLSAGGSAGHGGAWSLDISEGTRSDLGGRYWSIGIGSASEERESREEDRETMRETRKAEQAARRVCVDAVKLLDVFAKSADGETKSNAWAMAGLNSTRGGQALAKLLGDGLIVATEVQKRSATYDGFKVTPTSPTTPTRSDNTPTV